jgi:wyosine [tRNA(Phe)-imidazoG37] synthetase (radical SAM superfamily)
MVVALLQLEVLRGPQRRPGLGQCLEVLPTSDTGRPGVFPGQGIIVTRAARRLIELSKAGEKLDSIAVLGPSDPTLHAEFREITENLKELARKWYPKLGLTLLTGPLHLTAPEVRHACSLYERMIVRLDGAAQKTFSALQPGSKGASLKTAIDQLAALEHSGLVLRTQLCQGTVDTTTEAELKAWIALATRLRPQLIQISTIAKGGTKGQKPVAKGRLEDFAAKLTEKSGTATSVLLES